MLNVELENPTAIFGGTVEGVDHSLAIALEYNSKSWRGFPLKFLFAENEERGQFEVSF